MKPYGAFKRGGAAILVDVRAGYYFETTTDPQLPNVVLRFRNDRTVTLTTNFGGTTTLYDWLRLPGAVGNYDIRFTPTSGNLSAGSENVWENLGTTRLYQVFMEAVGTKTCTGLIEIRLTATGAVQDSASVDLIATCDP